MFPVGFAASSMFSKRFKLFNIWFIFSRNTFLLAVNVSYQGNTQFLTTVSNGSLAVNQWRPLNDRFQCSYAAFLEPQWSQYFRNWGTVLIAYSFAENGIKCEYDGF
jgi:hypothetical protein